jgi:hypothetical protein
MVATTAVQKRRPSYGENDNMLCLCIARVFHGHFGAVSDRTSLVGSWIP